LSRRSGFDVEGDRLFSAGKARHILNYLLRRRGMLTSPAGEAYGFIRSDPELTLPDLELFFGPALFFDEGLAAPNGARGAARVHIGQATEQGPDLASLRRSGQTGHRPAVSPTRRRSERRSRAFGCPRKCCCACRDVLGSMVRPLGAPDATEDALAAAVNAESHTMYHPVGTCRMGADPESVVTPKLQVRGVLGLRVADASVMPNIVRGHTHAASMLIGARAVDLITVSKRA
jgi:choline dehydrogenase